MRFFAVDGDRREIARSLAGDGDEHLEKPADASSTQCIVLCFEIKVVRDVVAAGIAWRGHRIIKHSRPELIKLAHTGVRISPSRKQCNRWYYLAFSGVFVVYQPLRNFGAVLAVFALLSPIFSQQDRTGRSTQTKPRSTSTAAKRSAKPRPAATPKPDPAAENERLESAIAAASASEKAELLVKFIADYPKSELKTRAEESLAGARAAMADERLSSGDTPTAGRLFKLAVEDAPKPYSDRLFSGVIATIPANLYWRGFKAEGLEMARLIESHVASDANKLLLLSTFYLGSENGDEAKRIAEAAIKLDEKNAARVCVNIPD